MLAAVAPAATLPLENPGFENGLEHWSVAGDTGGAVRALPEAASIGAKGLRVQTGSAAARFVMRSDKIPVVPGRSYTVDFWAGGGGVAAERGRVLVEVVFEDAAGGVLKPDMAKIRVWPAREVAGGRYFGKTTLGAAAPAGAVTLAVRIKPAGTAAGAVDLDDFKVQELADATPAAAPGDPSAGHPVPITDPGLLAALLAEIAGDPHRGAQPPKIVIKLDDLKPSRGGVHARWVRAADFARDRKIKIGLGIIAKGMEEECAPFCAWVKERRAAGGVEFWFHGYDHSGDGKIMEFSGRPYEFQKEHVVASQELAKKKLGFAFASFGAPFNATDATAAKVLAEDTDLKVWMYGDTGRSGGKIVLERSYAVNLESPTIIANYGAFIEGYAHNRGAAYFVLQGHPAGWGDDRFAEFVRIVDFLIAQKAEFVFASDFASRADLGALAGPASR